MDIGNIANIAISLAFLFVVMSMIASTVQEMAAGMWNSRGRYLRHAIGQMFGDPAMTGLARDFYANPLIAGLLPPGTNLPRLAWLRRVLPFVVPRLPSYIPPATFADALTDMLERTGALQTGAMQPALAALWRTAAADKAAFKIRLAAWYTAATDRQSGRYKRNVQRTLFGYGLLAAVALNVDTLTIAGTLWSSANTQQVATIAAQATAAAKASTDPAHKPVTLQSELATLHALRLPIGWGTTDGCIIVYHVLHFAPFSAIPRLICPAATAVMEPLPAPIAGQRPLTKVDSARWLGWVLTALAISLGAQFWFDLISKLANLRAGGDPADVKPPATDT